MEDFYFSRIGDPAWQVHSLLNYES